MILRLGRSARRWNDDEKALSKMRVLKSRLDAITTEEANIASKLLEAEEELSKARKDAQIRHDAQKRAICPLACPVCRQEIPSPALAPFLQDQLGRLATLDKVGVVPKKVDNVDVLCCR